MVTYFSLTKAVSYVLRVKFSELLLIAVPVSPLPRSFIKMQVLGTSAKESVGAPDQMTVSQHSKSEGWHHSLLSPPPSSLFCNLCKKELYLRHKYN